MIIMISHTLYISYCIYYDVDGGAPETVFTRRFGSSPSPRDGDVPTIISRALCKCPCECASARARRVVRVDFSGVKRKRENIFFTYILIL